MKWPYIDVAVLLFCTALGYIVGITAFLDTAPPEPWSALVSKLHVSLPSQC